MSTDDPKESYATWDDLEDLLVERREELQALLGRAVLKQHLLGQVDMLDWVMQQLDQLRRPKTLPKQEYPPVPPIPKFIQEVLDGLDRAGERYYVSNDGRKVYTRKNDGQWELNASAPLFYNKLTDLTES